MLTLLIVYVYQKRRITPKIQMSASLEKMFVPYSVEELEKMEKEEMKGKEKKEPEKEEGADEEMKKMEEELRK